MSVLLPALYRLCSFTSSGRLFLIFIAAATTTACCECCDTVHNDDEDVKKIDVDKDFNAGLWLIVINELC